MSRALIFLVLLFSISTSFGQSQNLKFRRLGIPDGLSQNSANAIVQDKDGYIWVATQDGLNKYNGYDFTVFKHKREDKNSIRDNFIQALLVDKNGSLWIGTSFGIDLLQRGSDTFEHISIHNSLPTIEDNITIYSLTEDNSGLIWIGTGEGLLSFDQAKKTFELFTHSDSASIAGNGINALKTDKENNLWIATNRGLSKYDLTRKKFSNFHHDPKNPNSLLANYIIDLSIDSSQTIWIGTFSGLSAFDQSKNEFKNYANNPRDEFSLNTNNISRVFVDRSNDVWVGASGNGLNKFDRNSQKFFHFTNSISNLNSLSHNDVLSIFEDRTHVLWIGTDGGGLSLCDRKPAKFKHTFSQSAEGNSISSSDIWCIFKDDKKNIFVGTNDGGLNIIDPQGKVRIFEHSENNAGSISSNSVYSVLEDSRGNYWIGTNDDLDRYNPSTKTFSHILKNKFKRSVSLRFLVEDSKGFIWCGGSFSLIRFNPETKEYVEFKNLPTDSTSITPDRVTVFFEDSKNRAWVGTSGGLSLFNRETGKFKQYLHDPNNLNTICYPSIQAITEDRNGNIWIGTGLGLCVLNPETNQFKSFTEDDGLPNSCIYDILTDDNGFFWVSTNNGITKFDPISVYESDYEKRKTLFRNFSRQDGLQSNEFNDGAAFKSRDGELFFGGINGFNQFFPDQIKDNPYVPSIVITNFKILDKPVPLSRLADRVVLNYAENVFSFEFSALDFTNPSNNRYAYLLEGFDEHWINSGTRRYISYTNLDAGDYTFHVRGSNNDALWNNDGVSVRISIIPPFWKTKAAYFFYLLILLGIIYGIVRWRALNLEREKRMLEKMVAAKTSELKSSYEQLRKSQEQLVTSEKMRVIGQLASGIAHDINNILSIILGSSEILLNKEHDPESQKRISTITKAANDGASIIKRLQEFSKHEHAQVTGSLNLNEILTEVIEMTTYLIADKRKKENLTITFKTDFSEIPKVAGNASELRSVMTNIIVNAIDSFSKPGSIFITTLWQKPDFVQVIIKDEGKGIEKEILDRIFEPFFTTKGTRGSGLGLSQVYGIISRHHGKIEVESEYGKGTTFFIKIPVLQNDERENDLEVMEEIGLNRELKNASASTDGKKLLLVVEDEEAIRNIYHNVLTEMGLQAVFASTGEEGIEQWFSGQFDMIISDIGLPGISGWDFIQQVRSQNSHIPILVITGWGNEITSDLAQTNHVNKVINKPFKFDQLTKAVGELLG